MYTANDSGKKLPNYGYLGQHTEERVIGQEPSPYAGWTTAASGAAGAGLGAGLVGATIGTGGAALFLAPLFGGLLGTAGSSLGSMLEPKPKDVMGKFVIEEPEEERPNLGRQRALGLRSRLPQPRQMRQDNLSARYGVSNPRGFRA